MPQMSPMYWEILYFMFIMSMMMMMVTIFHMNRSTTQSSGMMFKNVKQLTWKW